MACVFYAIAVHLLVVGRGNALFRSSNTTLYRALAGWLAGRSLTHSLYLLLLLQPRTSTSSLSWQRLVEWKHLEQNRAGDWGQQYECMHCYHYYQALSTHIEKEPRAGHRSCLIRARTIDWQRGTGEVRRTEVCPRNKCNSSRWNGKPVAGSALNVNTEGHYCTSILLVIGVLASGSLKSPPSPVFVFSCGAEKSKSYVHIYTRMNCTWNPTGLANAPKI